MEDTQLDAQKDYELLLESAKYLLHNREIREFVLAFLDQRVPTYFRTIPAAQRAEHHMVNSHGEGGLVRHTLSVLVVLLDLVKLEYLQLKATDKDLILSAAILHDTFKWGKDGLKYQRTHPSIAAQEILSFAKERNQEQLGKILGSLVISHMGQFNSNHKPSNRGQFLVHLGDYIGSRSYLTISFDLLHEAIKEVKKRKELQT